MRINFVLPDAGMSGGTRVIAIYARALAQMGHEVRVVSLPLPTIPYREKLKSWLKGNGWPRDFAQQSHFDGVEVDHHVLDHWRPISDDDVPDGDVVIATWWETAE